MAKYLELQQSSIADAICLGFDPTEAQLNKIGELEAASLTDTWRRLVLETQPLQDIFQLTEKNQAEFEVATYIIFGC